MWGRRQEDEYSRRRCFSGVVLYLLEWISLSIQSRWLGVLTLFLVVAISYVDRINVSVLITDHEFLKHAGIDRLDRAAQGFLATCFMLGYGISSIVLTPFCSSVLGIRRSLSCSLVIWGAVTVSIPFIEGYLALVVSRVLLGVAEGPLFSLAYAYIKSNFNNLESGTPNAFVGMGAGIGLAMGYPAIGYMLHAYGWEVSFYVLSVVNVFIGLPLVLMFVRMPRGGGADKQVAVNWPSLYGVIRDGIIESFKVRSVFIILALSSLSLSYIWGSSNWLPVYFKEVRGFSLLEMGWLASLPLYAVVLASICSGVVIDRINRKNLPVIFLCTSLIVAAFVFMAITVVDRYWALCALVMANFFWGLQGPAIPAIVQQFTTDQNMASTFGVVNGSASLVAAFMPAMMGAMIMLFANFEPWVETPGMSDAAAGFYGGFFLLIGSQVLASVFWASLWFRDGSLHKRNAFSASKRLA